MARSKCSKCEHTSFEVKSVEPTGYGFKVNFVQCSSCGAVVGVLDHFNIGQLLKNFAKKANVGDITRA